MLLAAGFTILWTPLHPPGLTIPDDLSQPHGTSTRIQSVDFLRGLIMVLMAIDHVRVYAGLPAGGPEPGIFFTRWITHFCAPGFVFLAGTSAFLHGLKIPRKQLSMFLLSRGLLLVILEVTLIRFLWTFNLNLSEFVLAGVIWMIGWCMVIMSVFVRLKPAVVGWLGVAIVLCQQAFGFVPSLLPEGARPAFGKIWEFIYPSGLAAPDPISVLYVIVPWIGVMMAGYGFGLILSMDPVSRKKWCVIIGASSIVLFLGIAGALAAWSDDPRPFIYQLLDQRKYPASQLYLLMTIGPLVLLAPYSENIRTWFSRAIITFGRVPFFYYLAHILVIHLSALVVQQLMLGELHHEWYSYAPFSSVPEENRWSLILLYAVFLADVGLLYFLCSWYARYKAGHPNVLTKYL